MSEPMKDGYYWYREWNATKSLWRICLVRGRFVHFFGQVSQLILGEYVTKYIEFDERIPEPGEGT